MDYTIKYTGFEEPIGIDEFFSKKLVKIEKFKWTNREISAEFTLNKPDRTFEVTLILGIPHNNDLVVSTKSTDLNTAINEAIKILHQNLVKIKEKEHINNY